MPTREKPRHSGNELLLLLLLPADSMKSSPIGRDVCLWFLVLLFHNQKTKVMSLPSALDKISKINRFVPSKTSAPTAEGRSPPADEEEEEEEEETAPPSMALAAATLSAATSMDGLELSPEKVMKFLVKF